MLVVSSIEDLKTNSTNSRNNSPHHTGSHRRKNPNLP